MSAKHIEKVQENQFQKTTAGLGEYIAYQPPYLTLQNLGLIKAQQLIKNTAAIDHGHQHNNSVANGNVKHQVGNTLIPIGKAKAVKPSAQITQLSQLPKVIILILTVFPEKVYHRIVNKKFVFCRKKGLTFGKNPIE